MFGFGKTAEMTDRFLAAAEKGDIGTVKQLLNDGAEINGKDKEGFTALMLATRSMHVDLVRLLLDMRADPNSRSKDGTSAATLAAPMFEETRKPEYLQILQMLIEKGINETIRSQVALLAQMVGIPEISRLL